MIMTIKEIVLTPDLANYCTVAAALKVIGRQYGWQSKIATDIRAGHHN